MDVVERLTLEAAAADTMLACEHRHRYQFAAPFGAAERVLDLCCGSGYGTAILAEQAREVLGVDNDAATVELAAETVGRSSPHVGFHAADAVAFLESDRATAFELIVCFEGLEHLRELDRALAALRGLARRGTRVLASIPNGRLFGEDNPYHVTTFGYDEAIAAFAGFPGAVMLPQYLAEGSLICPTGTEGTEVAVSLEDRREPEYANHFVFCVGIEPERLNAAHHGRIQVSASPVFNRWSEDLKLGARALRRENARLARAHLGQAGSAAAAALAGLARREAEAAAAAERCRVAEARVAELERRLSAAGAGADAARVPDAVGGGDVATAPTRWIAVEQPALARTEPDGPGDPNTWEHRRRRAADFLIPWIEQTVPLAGRRVLEYGCGNAAVSCALGERGAELIGVDIDAAGIAEGQRRVAEAGLGNVVLERHPLEEIAAAVRARAGTIDVFLLYAVLEHMTVAERLAVLRLGREVLSPGGVIVVCETPNRLFYFDHHTARIPFFHLLPDELALEYRAFSARPDFTRAIARAAEDGRDAALEAIVRWGRGVSFHEFEVVFGALERHVIASGYDPLLFAERPVHPEELMLARYLDRVRPELAPAFSRAWLDLILTPEPGLSRPPLLRPWTADTAASPAVAWTRADTLALPGPDAALRVELPHPTSRLVVGTPAPGRRARLRARPAHADVILTAEAAPADGHTAYLTFTLPAPAASIDLAAEQACEIVFVGYDA